jgi:glycogen(starch) synthase
LRRVLILSDFFPPFDHGGAERIAFYHAHGLRDRGYEVEVLATYDGEQVSSSATREEDGIRVHRWLSPNAISTHEPSSFANKLATASLMLMNPTSSGPLNAICKQFQPDIVHAHYITRLSYGAFVRCAPGVPHVLTFHGYQYECPKGGLYRRRGELCGRKPLPCRGFQSAMAGVLRSTDRILAISHFIEERLLEAGYTREQVVYLPNGVPKLEERTPTAVPRNNQFLFVGRVTEVKGIQIMLDAFAALADPQAKLIVVGDGDALPIVEARARQDSRVVVAGRLGPDAVAEMYRESMVTLVPSRFHEVMNTVTCEAQSWGRPVIASDVGGNRDLIRDGESGLLYPVDDKEALLKCMSRLAEDHDLADRLAEGGFRQVGHYSLTRHLDSLESLYADLTARDPD